MTNTDNENTNEVANDTPIYFEFLKNAQGELERDDNGRPILNLHTDYRAALVPSEKHADYCGNGSEKELPDTLIIPSVFMEEEIGGLAPGMFYRNRRVRKIVLPNTVTTIPADFCYLAKNLREVHNTEHVIKIENSAFGYTRIKKTCFPSLTTLGEEAFLTCAYLESADIGSVTEIKCKTFKNCALLREVIGEKVETIREQAFVNTRSLRYLPLLEHVTNIGDHAFFYSRISEYNLPENCTLGSNPFPMNDNTTDFWTDVKITPCINKIRTKLSQINSAWGTTPYLLDDPSKNYRIDGCPLFSTMHIHSAISGKYYSHPDEFIKELKQKGLSKFLYKANWPGHFENVAPLFRALGYHTEVIGTDTTLSKDDYQTLVPALAAGAYIYTQVGTYDDYAHGAYDRGHAVVLYGINELGEVCVLDSDVLHETFRSGGLEPGIDVYTYTMPYQNMVGPGSDFVIVYPPKEEPSVEWTGSAAANMFTSASLPSEYPENQVTISRVIGDDGLPGSGQGILTAYRVGTKAYRTFVPQGKAALYLQVQDPKMNDSWLGWKAFNRKDFARVENDGILNGTLPCQLPVGVNTSVIPTVDSGLPEGVKGCLTAYHLFSNAAYAREEWKPDGSANVYVRHATSHDQWGNWYVFESTPYANSVSQ